MLICQVVIMGYSLLPPQGCNIALDTFHIDWVQCLIIDNLLAFMHQYSFAGVSFSFLLRALFDILVGWHTHHSHEVQ
jgi:hypothetical protein